MKKIGLMVGRFQPLHKGHTKIINKMIEECHTVIIGLGSSQMKREKHDPWTVEERMTMIKNVYGERVKIVPLQDLGTDASTDDWVDYVMAKIEKLGLPSPTDYYTGSDADAVWYKTQFWSGFVTVLMAETSRFIQEQYEIAPGEYRLLHILDRRDNPVPSGTEVRMFLETRDGGWTNWVPAVNQDMVRETHPDKFKVPK